MADATDCARGLLAHKSGNIKMNYLDQLRIETLLTIHFLRKPIVRAFLLILFIASVPISHIQAQRENPNYFLTFDDGNPINPHYYWGQYQYDSGFVFDAGGDRDFDIRGGNGITLGPNLGDQMIDNAGDVNGDGLDDLIILGMLGEKGEAFVVFGSPGGFSGSFDLSTLDGSNGFVVNSRDDPPAFGLTVLTDLNRGRAAGDVNGDGYDDIILSASQTSYWAQYYDVGEVFILFGKSDFPASMSVSELDGSNGFSMRGAYQQSLYLGHDVSAAGDVNSDGIDDFIIATRPLHGVESPLYVVFGNNNGFDATFDLSSLDGSNGFVIGRGSEASDPGMCSAGDFNGDGIDDILIGAQTDEYDLGDRVHLIFGKPVDSSFPDTLAIPSFDGNNGFTISGLISDVKGGRSVVSSAGDVNGDGYDDILIGNQLNASDEYVRSHNSENGIYEGVGETFVVFGGPNDSFSANTDISTLINGTDGFVVRGIVAKGQLGYSLSSADVNNDGFDDMIMGCSEGSIASFAAVLYGGTSFPDSLDLLTLHTDSTGFAIASVSGGLGRCVSGMGDTNGDGVDDFAISSGSTAYMFYGEKKLIAPVLSSPIADQQTYEDEPFSFTIPSNTFADQNPNDIQTLSAQLTGGEALPSWLSFNSETNTFSGTPTEEGDVGILSIEVISTDEDDLSVTDTFSLEVIANDPPVFTSPTSVSVVENTTIVQTVTATDVSSITFALGEGIDDDLFNIDELSGELTFVDAPDFEDPIDSDGDNIYEVVVAAFDAFESVALQNITITVTDVDETAPTFTSATSVSFEENSTGVAYTATANETVTFTLGSTKDEARFALANDNEISFSASPDFEDPQDGNTDNAYLLDVIATDAAGNSNIMEVTITVTDADDTAPTFTSATTVSFEENSTGVAYTATANETVTFTLGSTKDEARFALANDNEISFSASPDFEDPQDGNTDNAYLLDVIATDAAGNSNTMEVTITVTDADEIAPSFISAATVSFEENSTGVAYTATANETVTFTLGSTKDEARFALANDNEISFSASPDFEDPQDGNTDNAYLLDVIATDGVGNATTMEVTITVTDADEIAPSFISAATVSFEENSTGVAYTATANETVTFTLGSTKDEARFALANDNEISFSASPDFEDPQDGNTDNAYLLDVIATDGVGNATTMEVTITVTDADEIAPSFISAVTVSFEENSTAVAYTATANETVTFTLGSTKDEAHFVLTNANEISFISSPDFENPQDGNTDNAYLLDVIATDVAGNATTLAVTISVRDVVIDQLITFDALPDKTFGDPDFDLSATGGASGNAVTYISSDETVATISGITVTILGAGSTTIAASQVGGGDYNDATDVQQDLLINKAPLTVTANDQTRPYNTDNPTLMISYDGLVGGDTEEDLETRPAASTTAQPDSEVGTYPITVAGGADNNYTFTYVEGTLTITSVSQQITFEAIPDQDLADSNTLELQATSSAGLPITYTMAAGDGSIDGQTLTMNAASIFTVTATQAGTTNYETATAVSQTFEVTDSRKQSQTISFEAIPDTEYGEQITLVATASSGLPVSYVLTSGEGMIADDILTIEGVGNYEVMATQTGDDDFNPGPDVTQIFTVEKAPLIATADNLSITYEEALPELIISYTGFVNGDTEAVIDTAPTVSTTALGLGNSDAGTYPIILTGGADSNYELTLTDGTLTINKADQVITFDAIADIDLLNTNTLTLSAGSDTSLPITFTLLEGNGTITGSTLTANSTGNFTVEALQAGNTNYHAATIVTHSFVVTDSRKDDQTIDFPAIADKTYGDVFTLTTTASSNLSVTYEVLSGPATVSGEEITVRGVGTITIEASQTGDANFNAAPSVMQSFMVGKATLTVTADDQSRVYNTDNPTFTLSYGGFIGGDVEADLDVRPTASTSADMSSDAGTYTIMASGGSDENYSFQYLNGTLTITKVQAIITITDLQQEEDGTAKIPTVSTDPAGLNFTLTWAGGSAPITAGSYDFIVTIDETNYKGEEVGTLVLGEKVLGLKEAKVLIYPNPAQDYLTIESSEELQVEVMSLDGKQLLRGNSSKKIDLKSISSGMHLLRLTNDEGDTKVIRFLRKAN